MIFTAKRALVTGGAQGIGFSAAEKLAREGVEVIITDINEALAKEQAENLQEKYGIQCYSKKMDVSNGQEVKETIGKLIKDSGFIDILVNNAGICYPAKPLHEITEEEWIGVFKVNVLGMINCVNAVIPGMKEKRFGKIINMSSSSGFTGGISVSASYAVSKAGVMALTKNMAKQFGPFNINVNALSPGVIKTAMTEKLSYDMTALALRRFGEQAEVGDLVAFLASDESSYLTGTTIDINGGLYMR
ncbi:SDR family NAD(P)-dependent oxidoreductase [Aminipila sp.]|uniref:SDR family NAD(P)-dependent oxidoreductase n=3 Tax=Aminipila sp. TaxID=2060095 RepID=UPI00289F9D62|nr:SDR family NAD(P)-dependent oxidoreductase [Aminipila sp.]